MLALNPLLVSWLGCQRQTWESATEAGQQAVQQGIYADAERILLMAEHQAEKFRLKDRRVSVNLSQLAHVYVGKGKYAETEQVELQVLKIYQTVHSEFHAGVVSTLNKLGNSPWRVPPACRGRALAEEGSGHQRGTLALDHPTWR